MDACRDLSNCEKCLAMIAHGSDALHDGDFASAEEPFRVALILARTAPAEQARDLIPLTLYNVSLLRHRQDHVDEGRQIRDQGSNPAGYNCPSAPVAAFQYRLDSALA